MILFNFMLNCFMLFGFGFLMIRSIREKNESALLGWLSSLLLLIRIIIFEGRL